LVAGDFIPLVFGSKWQGAIAPLEILAFYASFRCIVALLPSILNVTGDSRFAMRTSQAGLILMPTAFYLGSRWGAAGIAYGWVFAYPVIALCMYRRVFRRIEMPWWDYLETIRPAVTGCVAMSAAVETLKHVLPAGFPMSVRLGLEVLVGGAAFALILVALHRERFAAFWKFVSELRNPVAASAVDPGASRV
jgi:O-antigen/teichoic acid export membrane protein